MAHRVVIFALWVRGNGEVWVLGKPGFRGSLLYRWSFFNRRPFVKWYVSIARFDQRVIHRETNDDSRVDLTIHWWSIEVWDFADSQPRAEKKYHRGDVGKSWLWNLSGPPMVTLPYYSHKKPQWYGMRMGMGVPSFGSLQVSMDGWTQAV